MAILVKTVNGLAYAAVKTRIGLAVSSLKSINGLDTTGTSDTIAVTGQTIGTLRNNFGGCVGFQFSTGGASATVTQLGRYMHSGNSGSHTLYLTDTAVNPNVLGSVIVNMSGGTPGTYVYGTLSSPVVISASTAYAVMSGEAISGDQWSDNDATITTDAYITATASAGSPTDPPNLGLYFTTGSAGSSYVTVNFKYH